MPEGASVPYSLLQPAQKPVEKLRPPGHASRLCFFLQGEMAMAPGVEADAFSAEHKEVLLPVMRIPSSDGSN